VQTTALRPGTHDRAAMTWGTYGGRAGVWRLIKILDDNKVPGTFVANARALELAPAAAKQAIKSGHEIAAHSYTQDALLAYQDPKDEKTTVNRCVDSQRKITAAGRKAGYRPSCRQPRSLKAISRKPVSSGTAITTTSTCPAA
jgi:peptidoglycan/xylan/chitin deacetylase (PgdA/CDA1 family)